MTSALHDAEHIDTSLAVVVRLRGVIEARSLPEVRSRLAEISPGATAVIDLGEVTAIDPAGVGCLLGAVRRARQSGGEVAIEGASMDVERLLRSMGVDRVAQLPNDPREGSYSTAL